MKKMMVGTVTNGGKKDQQAFPFHMPKTQRHRINIGDQRVAKHSEKLTSFAQSTLKVAQSHEQVVRGQRVNSRISESIISSTNDAIRTAHHNKRIINELKESLSTKVFRIINRDEKIGINSRASDYEFDLISLNADRGKRKRSLRDVLKMREKQAAKERATQKPRYQLYVISSSKDPRSYEPSAPIDGIKKGPPPRNGYNAKCLLKSSLTEASY